MKLLQQNYFILTISALLIILGLVVANTYLAFIITFILFVFALLNKKQGLLILVLIVSTRPFLTEMNPGYVIIGDLVIFGLLLRTFYDSRKNIKSLFSFHPFEWAFFAFILIGTVSALITGVGIAALITQIRAYVLFYIVFYVAKRMVFQERDVRQFAITTFIMAIILSLQGYVEKISDKTMLMPKAWTEWYLSYTNHIRIYSLLKGPNELSLFLIIAFILALYLLFRTSNIKYKVLIYIGLSIVGAAILLTYSRGALLCLAVFIPVYLLISRKLKQLIPVLLVAIISAGIFVGVNQAAEYYYDNVLYSDEDNEDFVDPDELEEEETTGNKGNHGSDRFKGAFSEDTIEQSKSAGRIYYVDRAIAIFKDYPIIGAGFATFGGAATLKYSSPIYEDYDITRNFYSDNQYILILAETGVVGVLMLFALIVFLGIFVWKRRNHYFSPLMIFLFLSVIVGGMVYNILENDSFMFYFFATLGLAFQYKDPKE